MSLEDITETTKKLKEFENEIESLYDQGKIKAPVHLSGGNEGPLIEIFKDVGKDDWVFSSYRNHYQALLKGIPPDWLKNEIIEGRSMYIMSDEHKFFSSSIVPGHLPIALGVSMAIKRKGLENKVWAFCGDMASETGVFHECVKYAIGHDLPINFVVEDDGLSVYTPTKDVWKKSAFSLEGGLTDYSQSSNGSSAKVKRYSYERSRPHHGIGVWVEFPDEKKVGVDGVEYIEEVKKAMELLGNDERTVFVGQTVGCKGSPIYNTLEGVSEDKKIELPIMEEVQMGISTGLALAGYTPVSIYPRFDFLTLATNQLVNHLDKIRELSNGRFNPKVIIRTMVGSRAPLYPGPQHFQDHTEAYREMLTNVDVVKLDDKREVVSEYKRALESDRSSLLIEPVDLLHT